jgi:putative ABC transport system ATP-binding protein
VNVILSGIEVRFPDRAEPLFRLPALEIASGARVLIHGSSGCGKTTLLHLISGQFPPHAGRVLVGVSDLTAEDANARAGFRRAHFGILFQRWNLIDHLPVLENVLLGISLRGPERRRNRALEALRKTGLAEFADRRGGLLSPGEQQRAAVARVWAAAPDVILADEPTSSLDGPGAERVMDALWEASEGRTMIVVSHDPRLRARFADMRDFGEMIA